MTPYLEIGGDYREVLPGVHLVELPLPFSLGLVNVYLVRLDEGWLLIDCGMDTEACLEALTRALEGLNVAWTDIRQVLVTHMHPDHVGLARKVLDRTGAQLIMHRREAELLAEVAGSPLHTRFEDQVLADSGIPGDLVDKIEASFVDIRRTFCRLDPAWPLGGGEEVPTRLGPLQVIWTRGHSPGHVCLYNAPHRALFAGDQILEHITPNIGFQPDHDALGEFLSSLERLAELDVDLILPSHGAPFRGHRAWIEQTHRHHAERCAQIEAALSPEPKTAHELVGDLWNRRLSPFHHRFAVFEVLAHLEYLKQRGRLEARRDGEALRWSLA